MSIYRFAGATLMLAGLIDASNRSIHKYSHNAIGCEKCRKLFRENMDWWLDQQA